MDSFGFGRRKLPDRGVRWQGQRQGREGRNADKPLESFQHFDFVFQKSASVQIIITTPLALTSNKYPWIQFIIIWVRNSSQVFKNQLIFRFLKNKQKQYFRDQGNSGRKMILKNTKNIIVIIVIINTY